MHCASQIRRKFVCVQLMIMFTGVQHSIFDLFARLGWIGDPVRVLAMVSSQTSRSVSYLTV